MWNADSEKFEESELSEETVVGNFTRLSEKDDNGVAERWRS